jgi:hypothetical protein
MNHKSAAEMSKRLADDLNQTTVEFMRLQSLAMEIIMEAPSGIPVPDGTARIVQAGKVAREAFAKYQRAVKRYRDFVDKGVVPEDLTNE